jgi:hypothetical protein
VATTIARSIGGKSGLTTSTFAVVHGEIARRPTLSPASHLAFGKSDAKTSLGITDGRLFVDQQHESKALSLLYEYRSSSHGDASLLQKNVRKDTD